MTSQSLTARIEVFRPGTFTPMQGEPITYSAADLRAVADAYDAATAPAPIVIGHPEIDAPAFGWVEGFDYDSRAERLVANLHQIEPAFAGLVKAGRFKKVSLAFFGPGQPHNPVPGTWYPKHVGFLGAAAPAVSGLRNASFAGAAGATFTTSFGAAGQSASLFRRLRDWMIDTAGLEAADKVLPPWEIDWLDEADEAAAAAPAPGTAIYTAGPLPFLARPDPQPQKDTSVTEDPAFASREAAIATREAALATREAQAAHAEHLSFAEGLVADGRLIPASRDRVVAILDALPGQSSVSFAAGGEPVTLATALRDLLLEQPKVLTFGAQDLGEQAGTAETARFASDGRAIDPAGLATHHKALDYQRAHPGTAYLDAVRAVS